MQACTNDHGVMHARLWPLLNCCSVQDQHVHVSYGLTYHIIAARSCKWSVPLSSRQKHYYVPGSTFVRMGSRPLMYKDVRILN